METSGLKACCSLPRGPKMNRNRIFGYPAFPTAAVVGRALAQSGLPTKTLQLRARNLNSESFKPFGQVVSASYDGKPFDQEDAELQLDQGTPRFYIMHLPHRGLKFDRITYHAKVTQCLGGLSGQPWYLAVAAPSGSTEVYPSVQDLQAFRIPPGKFVKLHAGTWHAGPLFQEEDGMDFYNLELADTNVVDHNTHVYTDAGLQFEIIDL